MRSFWPFYCLACFQLIPAYAQDGAIGIPSLGFAHDQRSSQVRPVYGIPGAAILGEAVAAGFSSAAISPRNDLALAVSDSDRQLYALRLPGGSVYPIPGVTGLRVAATHSQIVFSPAGRTAVIVGERLQVLTGLSTSLTLEELTIPPSITEVGMVAIADDAQQLLLASKTTGADVIWLLIPGAAPFPLPVPGEVAAAAFRPESHDAIAATRSGDIYLIRNPGPLAEISLVYAGDEQTSDPVAIRLSVDGKHAYTVNSVGMLSSVDLLARSAASARCKCVPTGLHPVLSETLFRVTEISDGPMLLFDTSATIPRVWFVPPDNSAAGRRIGQ
jgi:hypothetical protein